MPSGTMSTAGNTIHSTNVNSAPAQNSNPGARSTSNPGGSTGLGAARPAASPGGIGTQTGNAGSVRNQTTGAGPTAPSGGIGTQSGGSGLAGALRASTSANALHAAINSPQGLGAPSSSPGLYGNARSPAPAPAPALNTGNLYNRPVFNASATYASLPTTGLLTTGRYMGLHQPVVQASQAALDRMARTMLAESSVIKDPYGNINMAAMSGVGDVIRNRVLSSQYPDTVSGVLTQRKQFSPTQKQLAAVNPTSQKYAAALSTARAILSGESPLVAQDAAGAPALNYGNLHTINTKPGYSSAKTKDAFNSMAPGVTFADARRPNSFQHTFGTIGKPSDVAFNTDGGLYAPSGIAVAADTPPRASPPMPAQTQIAGRPEVPARAFPFAPAHPVSIADSGVRKPTAPYQAPAQTAPSTMQTLLSPRTPPPSNPLPASKLPAPPAPKGLDVEQMMQKRGLTDVTRTYGLFGTDNALTKAGVPDVVNRVYTTKDGRVGITLNDAKLGHSLLRSLATIGKGIAVEQPRVAIGDTGVRKTTNAYAPKVTTIGDTGVRKTTSSLSPIPKSQIGDTGVRKTTTALTSKYAKPSFDPGNYNIASDMAAMDRRGIARKAAPPLNGSIEVADAPGTGPTNIVPQSVTGPTNIVPQSAQGSPINIVPQGFLSRAVADAKKNGKNSNSASKVLQLAAATSGATAAGSTALTGNDRLVNMFSMLANGKDPFTGNSVNTTKSKKKAKGGTVATGDENSRLKALFQQLGAGYSLPA